MTDKPLRVCLVHPGARWSVGDVWRGLYHALERRGVEVVGYNLGGQIEVAAEWLHARWERAANGNPDHPRYTDADIYYRGSHELPYRALRERVDVVIVTASLYLHPDPLVLLRRAGIPVALHLTEDPYQTAQAVEFARYADLVWTNERTSVPELYRGCRNVRYLPHAYDPELHYPAEPAADTPRHDVTFVGTGFPERIDLLRRVNWQGIDLGLYGTWNEAVGTELEPFIRGGITDNARTADLYRAAKIGLNLFRRSREFDDSAGFIEYAESLNPRLLELAACGVFTITDARAEVGEVFGGLMPTFEWDVADPGASAKRLEEKVRLWLTDSVDADGKLIWVTTDRYRSAGGSLIADRVAGRTFDRMAEQVVSDLVDAGIGKREAAGVH